MENTTSRKPLSLADIEQWLDQLGAKMPHKRRLYRAWLNRAEWPSTEDESFPKSVRAALGELRSVLEGIATIASRHPGSDPESERLLVTLADGQTVESVLLPRQGVCVSTQLGCAVGCRFCMTGRSGLIRQLSDAEIVAQVHALVHFMGPRKKWSLWGWVSHLTIWTPFLAHCSFWLTTVTLVTKIWSFRPLEMNDFLKDCMLLV